MAVTNCFSNSLLILYYFFFFFFPRFLFLKHNSNLCSCSGIYWMVCFYLTWPLLPDLLCWSDNKRAGTFDVCSWCIALVVKAVRRLPFLKSHNSDSVLLLEPFLLISLLFCGSQARLLAVVLFFFCLCVLWKWRRTQVYCVCTTAWILSTLQKVERVTRGEWNQTDKDICYLNPFLVTFRYKHLTVWLGIY